jgi:dihydroorotate dehydrogenase (fumarate)
MTDLSTSYLGLKLRNPLIAGSSGMTDALNSIRLLEENGIGAIVLKSLFEEEILLEIQANMSRMSSDSFLYPETVDFYEENSIVKESTDSYLELIREAKAAVSVPVIASINCRTASQWIYFPKLIQEAGADALELNLFMLPTDFSQNSQEYEENYFEIVKAIRKMITIPIALKVGPYFSNLPVFLKQLSEVGVQGLVLFNRFYNPDIDLEKMEVVSGQVMSSPSDISMSLRWIAIMANRVSCDLAATTGVHDGAALIKQLLAGATTVQVASTLYINGPEYIKDMLSELEDWMKEKGYGNLHAFRGLMSQAFATNPAVYERVQFMKYFRGYKK